MYSTVLIGIDELEGGMDAVALARTLGSAGAAMTLTRVHGGYATVNRGPTTSLREAERRTAEVALRRACRATGIHDAWAYGAPSVGVGFEQLVGYLNTELIVFGSGPNGSVGYSTVPSSLLETLPRVNCATVIAPSGYARRPRPITRVGVAFEDTGEGHAALSMGRHLGEHHDAEVVVFDKFSDGIDFSRGVAADAARRVHAFSSKVDVLVIGARGSGPLRRLTHANATPSLVQYAAAPVMMVTAQTSLPTSAGRPASERWTTKVAAGMRDL